MEIFDQVIESLCEREEVQVQAQITMETNVSHDESKSMKEIIEALNSMKSGKGSGFDGNSAKMLSAGQRVKVVRFFNFFNLCQTSVQVPGDWCKNVVVPQYKEKVSQQNWKNYRSISLLNIVGTLYAKVY